MARRVARSGCPEMPHFGREVIGGVLRRFYVLWLFWYCLGHLNRLEGVLVRFRGIYDLEG